MTQPPPAGSRIVISGLAKRYKKIRAVDGLSFTAEPGRVTGFLGPNGSGKTTTLRVLLGLVRATAGNATIGGWRFVDLGRPLETVGAVLDVSGVHHGRTGRGHLRTLCAAGGLPAARADEVLDMVGLTAAADRKFRGYSLGMRQRLGVAAAMLGDPGVLVLDEPANGLDPEGIHWMRQFLRGCARDGRTVLVSSHQLAEMELMADDVVIIAGGQLVARGPMSEVLASLAGSRQTLVRSTDNAALAAAIAAAGGRVSEQDGGLLVAGTDAGAVNRAAVAAGVDLVELTTQRPNLETAFLELTRGEAALR